MGKGSKEEFMKTEVIDYRIRGASHLGYAALPEGDKYPAVIVAHTWAGRDRFVDEKAELLASMGYLGFALDMYGDGVIGSSNEENAARMQPLLDNREELAERVSAAYKRVKEIPGVDHSRIAIIGYCFGGLVSLDLARTGVDLRGSASFHGFLHCPTEPESKPFCAKVLAMHGMQDPMVGDEQLESFYKEMTEKNVDWQLHIYGTSMHAFTNPLADNPDFGAVYSRDADRRSWALLMDFLEEIFAGQ